MVPYIDTYIIEPGSSWKSFRRMLRSRIYRRFREYKVNPNFQTPVLPGPLWKQDLSDKVVIYPEQVAGNPLRCPNVVRWLLHKPGFHTGHILYGRGELYFFYNMHFAPFSWSGSKTSEHELRVIHYPLDLYNLDGALAQDQRNGEAHSIRKSRGKDFSFHAHDSVCIDGLPHQEIAAIFKRVKRFVCYDTNTAFSQFAALCGAESVVVPAEGLSIEQWQPNPSDAYGVAYGFSSEQLARAELTRPLVKTYLLELEASSTAKVEKAVCEIKAHFPAAFQ